MDAFITPSMPPGNADIQIWLQYMRYMAQHEYVQDPGP
jgi:hypothetical protein